MTESSNAVQVLVVDDTVIYRKILSDVLAGMPNAELAGIAASGSIALQKLKRLTVDLVLLDVFMPDMDGLETLLAIRKEFPNIAVVMVSGVSTRHAESTVTALESGALDFIRKPDGNDIETNKAALRRDLQPILRTVATRCITRRTDLPKPTVSHTIARPAAAPATPIMPGIRPAKINLVLIGSSTGGPNALAEVIPKIPQNLGVPVVIVQHMPPMFTKSLADHLDKKSPLNVREAMENEAVTAGSVLIAPGGRHLVLRHPTSGNQTSLVTSLTDSPPVNSCRPSVDVLFRSVATLNVGGILSVVLTGMGNDGAAGVASLKRHSCYSITQDQESCVVYGMPRAVVEKNLSDEVLPLDLIGSRIVELVKRR